MLLLFPTPMFGPSPVSYSRTLKRQVSNSSKEQHEECSHWCKRTTNHTYFQAVVQPNFSTYFLVGFSG